METSSGMLEILEILSSGLVEREHVPLGVARVAIAGFHYEASKEQLVAELLKLGLKRKDVHRLSDIAFRLYFYGFTLGSINAEMEIKYPNSKLLAASKKKWKKNGRQRSDKGSATLSSFGVN